MVLLLMFSREFYRLFNSHTCVYLPSTPQGMFVLYGWHIRPIFHCTFNFGKPDA